MRSSSPRTTQEPRGKGKNPRTTRVCEIVLDAAAELLVREGASAVTAVRVAEETGVARTTIYRHFPSASELLLDAIDRVVTPHAPTRISDNLEEDLIAALSNLRLRMTKRRFRLVFTALLDHANRDGGLVAAQRRFVNGVLQPIQDVLAAAIRRGDLPSTAHVETASAQLAGPPVPPTRHAQDPHQRTAHQRHRHPVPLPNARQLPGGRETPRRPGLRRRTAEWSDDRDDLAGEHDTARHRL